MLPQNGPRPAAGGPGPNPPTNIERQQRGLPRAVSIQFPLRLRLSSIRCLFGSKHELACARAVSRSARRSRCCDSPELPQACPGGSSPNLRIIIAGQQRGLSRLLPSQPEGAQDPINLLLLKGSSEVSPERSCPKPAPDAPGPNPPTIIEGQQCSLCRVAPGQP